MTEFSPENAYENNPLTQEIRRILESNESDAWKITELQKLTEEYQSPSAIEEIQSAIDGIRMTAGAEIQSVIEEGEE